MYFGHPFAFSGYRTKRADGEFHVTGEFEMGRFVSFISVHPGMRRSETED